MTCVFLLRPTANRFIVRLVYTFIMIGHFINR